MFRMTKIRFLCQLAAVSIAIGVTPAPASAQTADDVVFAPLPPTTHWLVTNEFAFWNPLLALSRISPDWTLNSGSLFSVSTPTGQAFTSGHIDDIDPNAFSSNGTDSAIFRLTSRRDDFRNVRVDMDLSVEAWGSTRSTPANDWDGVHMWLRYQNEVSTYYASLARRDGRMVIKKKCPGGWVNGGHYVELSDEVVGYPARTDLWDSFSVSVDNNADGSVTLQTWRDGKLILETVDRGTGCAPITSAGAVGLRGDNARLYFKDFTVHAL